MKAISYTVNGKAYPVRFGYGAIRWLGELWGLPGFQEVVEKVGALLPKEDETESAQLSFEKMDVIADLILSGIVNAAGGEVEGLDRGIIVDAFFEDTQSIQPVFAAFMESMPKARPQPAPKKKAAPKK